MGERGLNGANRLFVIKLKGFVKTFFFLQPKKQVVAFNEVCAVSEQ